MQGGFRFFMTYMEYSWQLLSRTICMYCKKMFQIMNSFGEVNNMNDCLIQKIDK